MNNYQITNDMSNINNISNNKGHYNNYITYCTDTNWIPFVKMNCLGFLANTQGTHWKIWIFPYFLIQLLTFVSISWSM